MSLKQLRADRRSAMATWLRGATPTGTLRWDGDDGRGLTHADIIQMRLDLADGVGTLAQRALWQTILAAQKAKWAELDAAFEAAKAALIRLPG